MDKSRVTADSDLFSRLIRHIVSYLPDESVNKMTYFPDKKGLENIMVPMQKFLEEVICQINPGDLFSANSDLIFRFIWQIEYYLVVDWLL